MPGPQGPRRAVQPEHSARDSLDGVLEDLLAIVLTAVVP